MPVSEPKTRPGLQLTALKVAGRDRIFANKASGVNVNRPELTKRHKALNKEGALGLEAGSLKRVQMIFC